MPMIEPRPDSAVTPGRRTRIEWDYDLAALTNRLWGGQRMFAAVAPTVARSKGADTATSVRVHCWASGAWTIRPWQMSLALTQEKVPPVAGFVLSPGTGLLSVPQTTTPLFRAPSGGGLATGGGLNPDGSDPAWRKKKAADKNWDEPGTAISAPLVASLTGAMTAAGTTFTVPLKCIASTPSALRANQGICIRFSIPGTPHTAYDYVGGFILGQYGVALRGDGMAEIWEYAPPRTTPTSAARWAFLTTFRWTRPQRICDVSHLLIAFPHLGPHGEKYISFYGSEMDNAQQSSSGAASFTRGQGDGSGVQATEFLFRWDESTSSSAQAVGAANVTVSGNFYLFERVDLRNFWQVSKLIFPPLGTLEGDEWAGAPNDPRAISSNVFQFVPAGAYSLAGTLSTVGDAARVTFVFTSAGNDTPILWGYRLFRNGVYSTLSYGSFATKGKRFSLMSGGPDPRGDSASFQVDDIDDSYPRLRNRGELPFRIVTTVTPESGAPYDVPLFAGYAIQPHRTKKGKPGRRAGMGGQGALVTSPSPEWSSYQITAAGMWHRLTQVTTRTALAFEYFAYDPAALPESGSSVPPGWKVTAAVGYLLAMAGFPPSMISLPDLPVRLRPGMAAAATQIMEPGASLAELIVKLCRSYLGRFLVFDPTAGATGKWTLTGAPPPGAVTPLMNFVGGPTSTPGSITLPLNLRSYTATQCPVIGEPESHVIPPENNHIWGMTFADGLRVDNHLYNFLSYAVPGASISPDPDSPHFLGGERLIIVADPTLWAGAAQGGGWQDTQKLINFILLRLFVTTCMARRVVTFRAPLAFVIDPVTTKKRSLRFYDPVTYRGEAGWFMTECRPEFTSDRIQMAQYELQRLVPYLAA